MQNVKIYCKKIKNTLNYMQRKNNEQINARHFFASTFKRGV